MAYDTDKGLISVATGYSSGSYTYTNIDKYIAHENLKITPHQMQDLDSYVNANGRLKRNVLSHDRTKIDFDTPYLTQGKARSLIDILVSGSQLSDGKCSEKEHKVRVRYFNAYDATYDTGYFYFPDVEFQFAGNWDGKLHYMPFRVGLIEY